MQRLWALVLAGCGFQPNSSTPSDALHDALNDALNDAPRMIDGVDAPGSGSGSDVGSGSSIVYIQSAVAEDEDKASETIAFPNAQRAGDLDVVMIGWYKDGTITSVTDTNGNAYALAIGPTMTAAYTESQAIYYACGIAAGKSSVTVTFASSGQDPDIRIAEYSGVGATGCLDTAVANTGSGTAVDSGPITVSANELLVAADKVYYITTVGDPSYATRVISGFGDIVEDREPTASGTYHALATQNDPGVWVMQLVAFH